MRTFRIITNDTIGNQYSWDIFTIDGDTPENSEYFFQDGDSPSFQMQEQITEKIENKDYIEI